MAALPPRTERVIDTAGYMTQVWYQYFFELSLAKPFVELAEMTSPPAPPAEDRVRLYAEDDGGGKTQISALYHTGSPQAVSVEP